MTDRSILDMNPKEARRFLLKPESYCSVDLPPYFQFNKVLEAIAKKLGIKIPSSLWNNPRKFENVNYSLLSNKDGRHAWRPFHLIHPVLYVSLVHHMTTQKHWVTIQKRFKEFKSLDKISCLSIPVESSKKIKDKAAQILEWWLGIEQQSLKLGMEYQYVFHADITECYSSIYTHSIAWALHGKDTAKKQRSDKTLIGNIIDSHIQDMQQGQTNGIPQGSVLMDFIAEMVLGYADLLLTQKIAAINDYRILRYRDDYRIFVNNPQEGEATLKALTEVLIGLGLKLNASKTTGAQPIISSLKPDKLAWLRGRQRDPNLQKHLLIIHAHGCEYPNAGSLVVALNEFYRRLSRLKRVQNPLVLISIVVDIAYGSPKTIPVCAAIVSKLLSFLKSNAERQAVLEKVYKKLSRFPNTGLMEIWLQRIGHVYGFNHYFEEKLCKLVQGQDIQLWNNDWITSSTLKKAIMSAQLINKDKVKTMKPIISPKEIEVFVYERY